MGRLDPSLRAIVQGGLGNATITQTMDTYSRLLGDVDDEEVEELDEAFG